MAIIGIENFIFCAIIMAKGIDNLVTTSDPEKDIVRETKEKIGNLQQHTIENQLQWTNVRVQQAQDKN